MQIQMNSLINPARYLRINTNSSQTLPKTEKYTLKSTPWCQYYSDTKSEKTQQYKNYIDAKIIHKNKSKLNPAIYEKEYTPRTSEI